MGIQLVWWKRDLRVEDHGPFAAAAAAGPVLALYVVEPSFWAQPEMDQAQARFVTESLRELDRALRARGARFVVRTGELPEVLERLQQELRGVGGIAKLWSHQECGGAVSYARDLRVKRWCRDRGIPWEEQAQDGVVRRLASRDGWAALWERRMSQTRVATPRELRDVRALLPRFAVGKLPSAEVLVPRATTIDEAQPGGTRAAEALLTSFLAQRGVGYRADMSSPLSAWEGCSRLSPHLAWGTLSLRTIYQATRARQDELKALSRAERDPRWLPSLRSFEARLRWHCHFLQKLEDEPALEHRNLHRAYDGLREEQIDHDPVLRERFAAWREGRTGYPMVDAVMRCLAQTGWVNFRMRAMVMSFASYHLWLHWRPTALFLATRFVDFEPGIHYAQAQMQSGTTGMNTVRIYSPAKQVRDQDPQGTFVKRWVPELAGVPAEHLPNPERLSLDQQHLAGCVIGRDYPAPIVDHDRAVREAKQRIFAVRRTSEARAEAQRIVEKHGSRKGKARRDVS